MTDLDVSIPSWLDKDFLTTTLQEDDSLILVNVLSFDAKAAVAAGNNYACVVIRVNVKYETNGEHGQKSLIIKTPFQEGQMKDFAEETGITEKERTIYKDLLPMIDKMVKIKLAPRSYNCKVPGTIVLEDLNEQGYVLCDRLKQLDFDHCNMFMKFISTFHASSLQIIKEDPELIAKVAKEVLYREDTNTDMKEYFVQILNTFGSVLEELEGNERFAKYYINRAESLWYRAIALHEGKKHLKVLNHGDTWTANMLFKHDDAGKVIDMKLIDFQICRMASPATDLMVFLLSSAQEDVKQHRLPELYSTYIETFNSTLESIGCEERLTWEEFQDEMKFAEDLPLMLLPSHTAVVLCEKQDVLVADDFVESSRNGDEKGHFRKILTGTHFINVAKFELKKLEEQGVLPSC